MIQNPHKRTRNYNALQYIALNHMRAPFPTAHDVEFTSYNTASLSPDKWTCRR